MSSIPVIAIVDDDEEVRVATESLIRSLGYIARTYASASEYLNNLHRDSVDCIIADIQMPGMTGIELYRKVVDGGKRIPIIFVTAFPTESLINQAMEIGASAFLSKPSGGDAIIGALKVALGACWSA